MDTSFLTAATANAKLDERFGPGDVRSLLAGDRFAELERRLSYFECSQHDRKFWDFDGRPLNPRTGTAMLASERAWWVPLSQRRPSNPVRLARVMVQSFTNLLYGENRHPTIRVEGDKKTEDWIQTVARVGKLAQTMIKARGYGGATGTASVSWYFKRGRPQFEAHKPQNLFVHSWEDRIQLIPEHASEVYLTAKSKWDGKGFNKVWYWYRRDWTPDADVVFKLVPYEKDRDPVFIVDDEQTVRHADGTCHLEWIQNLPSDDVDGLPDYDGLYDNFDSIDTMMSATVRGGVRNVDPTVKLKMDPGLVAHGGIKKGSDNALIVGTDGDAEYMELGGSSLDAGLKLVDAMRQQILEAGQCIVPDPNEVAAQGVSSLAIKAMFASMTAKADVLREQYGTAEERMLDKMQRTAREKTSMSLSVPANLLPDEPDPLDELLAPTPSSPAADPLTDDGVVPPHPEGELDESTPPIPEYDAQFVIDLPPKIEEEPMIDPLTGEPDASGETITVVTPRELGPGGEVSLEWPPYFTPTPQDQSQLVTSLTAATGGKAFMSAETATKTSAKAFGVDPAEEWRRVQDEAKAATAQQATMLSMGAVGAPVSDEHEQPPGSPPPHPAAHEDPVPPHPNADPDAHVIPDIDLTKKS